MTLLSTALFVLDVDGKSGCIKLRFIDVFKVLMFRMQKHCHLLEMHHVILTSRKQFSFLEVVRGDHLTVDNYCKLFLTHYKQVS